MKTYFDFYGIHFEVSGVLVTHVSMDTEKDGKCTRIFVDIMPENESIYEEDKKETLLNTGRMCTGDTIFSNMRTEVVFKFITNNGNVVPKIKELKMLLKKNKDIDTVWIVVQCDSKEPTKRGSDNT